MKKYYPLLTAALFSASILISCNKEEDEGLPPQISFKTTSGYTFTDDTVAVNSTVLTGINAQKSEAVDVLKSFSISRSYDGDSATGQVALSLPDSSGNTFSYDYTITTRSVPGTEVYNYTVVNRDGIPNTIHLTLTVQ